ncbi:uncharacterized protein LOC144914068 [Branchiostoma floridae x Branchiostoma belcheri]
MGRKLQHLLIFLLIILKEPNMPEGGPICAASSQLGKCSNLGLTSIPQNLPSSINNIHSIRVGTFSTLPKLRCLHLNSNKITSIEVNTFSKLPQLEKLYLKSNNITSIPVDSNNITSINVNTFSNLPQLRQLKLNDNKITFIQADTFSSLPRLRWLYLARNPLQCDCKMAPFRQTMIESPLVPDQVTCAQPANLSGQKLKDVSPKDLICKDPSKSTSTVDAQNSSAVSTPSLSNTENDISLTGHPIGSTFATLIV